LQEGLGGEEGGGREEGREGGREERQLKAHLVESPLVVPVGAPHPPADGLGEVFIVERFDDEESHAGLIGPG